MGNETSITKQEYESFQHDIEYLEKIKDKMNAEYYNSLAFQSKFILPSNLKWKRHIPTRGSGIVKTTLKANISSGQKKRFEDFRSRVKALRDFYSV
jgi:hypothetical protein